MGDKGTSYSGNGSRVSPKHVAKDIQLELARQKINRKTLTEKTGLSPSTIDKALAGRFTSGTIARIEQVLGRNFSSYTNGYALEQAPAVPVAAIRLGGYSLEAVEAYTGEYLSLRPSFATPGAIYSYKTVIDWNDADRCIQFREEPTPENTYAHFGCLHIPVSSMFIYLVSTLDKGWNRIIIASTLNGAGEMRGIISTLAHIRGAFFVPVSAPIYFRKITTETPAFGKVEQGSERHEQYSKLLKACIEEDHMRFMLPE
jgi:hypothetical protein